MGVVLALGPTLSAAAQQEPSAQPVNLNPISANGAVPSAAAETPVAPPGRIAIGPGDLLEINVFDAPELHQTLRVSDTGNVDVPLIGSLHIAGMTTAEAQQALQKIFEDKNLLVNPQVTVLILQYSTQGVTVLGEVAKPGVYPVLGPRTLLDILSDAGGKTALAGTKITIQRRNGSRQVVTSTMTNDPGEALANNVELEPGDTVIVPRAGIVYLLGDVGRSGGYVMANEGKMSLRQLVALGGNINRTASTKHTLILHATPAGTVEMEVDLKAILRGKQADIYLSANDVVFVPASGFKEAMGTFSAQSLAQSAAGAAVYSAIVP